ncbi:MAG: RNA polymerase subunit sigma-70 [Planctomycetaceae bacterium]|nr:RNA polymerase subunit sigma-70 [Planctomycetaceae bacterium]
MTGYQTDESADVELNGAELAHDLRCFIEDLSDSLDFSLKDLGEPALTVREISARYCVSSKTVDRWRDRGLASRRVSVDGRKRVVVPESTLQRFVATHQEEIDRGRNFNQMTDTERERLVSDARSLAGQGLGLTEVSRELGRRYGRATETVRYTLRDFDQANPEKAVFSCPEVEMSQENLALLYDLFCQGVSVPDLSRRFGRSKPAIHSALADFRVQRVRSMAIDFMYNEEFDSEAAEAVICGEPPEYDREKTSVRVPSNLPAYLAELYKVPLLNREQEQYYFRKMNFLKYRAATLQGNLGGRRGDMVAVKQIEELLDKANDVKNLLTRSNLRLVVSIAKRHLKPGVNFFELVSDGNMSLIRAIEKFDYSRGNKFSTYASWAIMKNFARFFCACGTHSA